MHERAAEIDAFLVAAGWDHAIRQPLSGDLSNRSYARLTKGTDTAILMDAEETMVPFLTMTHWLRANGFAAPQIIAETAKSGLILLEDLGDTTLNSYLAGRQTTESIDAICIDLLLALRSTAPPNLSQPDAKTMVNWTKLVDTHYPGTRSDLLQPFRTALHDTLTDALQTPATLSLRDFHADNVMWLPDRSGYQRLGLLDYQDAFLTHPAYDLVSYLTDARVDISPARRDAVLAEYLRLSNDDQDAFRTAFAALSAQRNLRILGIFARSAQQGKPHHLPKLPRVHRYFAEALQHPLFRDLRDDTLSALPDPEAVCEALS